MANEENNSRVNTGRIQRVKNPQMEIGKIPPQATEIEKAVLGAMMLDKSAVNDAIDVLGTPDAFYDTKHQSIFRAIQDLFGNSEAIDLLTVTEKLKKLGELELSGGAVYISSLTQRIGSVAHIEHHARIIVQKYIQRQVILMSNKLLKESFDETKDVFELLGFAQEELFAITQNNMKKGYHTMGSSMREAVEEIERAQLIQDGVSGIPTGFRDLDKITAGWQRSDMIVIAARPAMGKTAFVLSMARNTAVDYGKGVAIFSLEMSNVQLVKRLISAETRIPAEKLRKGDLAEHEMAQLHSRIGPLTNAPIYIDDTPGISIFELRAKCRRLKDKYDIDCVIIDYLQLMTAGTGSKGIGSREQEISQISRSIKEIARELNIPVIALSQLSRSVEQRGGDKRPVLSDLRESGAIEQDADIVSFIYRPEYYGIPEDDLGPTDGVGDIIIAKHRNGATDTVRLKFIGKYARFDNLGAAFEDHQQTLPPSAMGSSSSFDDSPKQTMTIRSKMDDEDYDFREGEVSDTPF